MTKFENPRWLPTMIKFKLDKISLVDFYTHTQTNHCQLSEATNSYNEQMKCPNRANNCPYIPTPKKGTFGTM
jgi:hypothetical protein